MPAQVQGARKGEDIVHNESSTINCGHYPIPYIPGFSRIRQPQQDAEENEEAYHQSQQQRYLERRLREEKRDLEVMKAQGASADELKAQRQRIRDASEDIDDFCAKTGRTRRRDRETAPVRATWPGETGPVERYGSGYVPANLMQTSQSQKTIANETAASFQVDKKEMALTANQKNAVESYVSGETMYINQALRGRMDSPITPYDKQLIKDLDEALDIPLGKAQTLYRSVDAEAVFGEISSIDFENLQNSVVYGDKSKFAAQASEKYVGKVEGATILEKGYMSTTKDADVAFDWGGFTGSEKPIVLRLNTPAKAHGLDLSAFEIEGDEQAEVLLMRGQRYKIRKITGENGSIVVNADILTK